MTSNSDAEFRSGEDDFLAGNVFDVIDGVLSENTPAVEVYQGLVGRKLGSYKLVRLIGKGGHGTVFVAELELESGAGKRQVALKIIESPLQAIEKLRRETEALQILSHSNIVSYIDAGVSSDGIPYLVMDLVDGDRIDTHSDLYSSSRRESLLRIIEACKALEHAHARGILHCDLKPQNILLRSDGQIVITDFGLSRFLRDGQTETADSRIGRGTPAYMAPEQMPASDGRRQPLTVATDVFGIGATLYRLLSGRSPRESSSSWTAIAQVVNKDPIQGLNTRNLRCSEDLVAVVARCLEVEVAKRYETIRDLRIDLENALHHRPVSARKPWFFRSTLMWIRREPVTAILCMTIAVVVLTSLFLQYANQKTVAQNNSRLKSALSSTLQSMKELDRNILSIQPGERLSGETRESLLETLAIQYRTLSALEPGNFEAAYEEAQATFVLGSYLHDQGKNEDAMATIMQSTVKFENLLEIAPNPERVHFDLFHTYGRLTSLYARIHDADQARHCVSLCLSHIEPLYVQHPENLDYAAAFAASIIWEVRNNLDVRDSEWIRKRISQSQEISVRVRDTKGSTPSQWRHHQEASELLAQIYRKEEDYVSEIEARSAGIEWARLSLAALPATDRHRWGMVYDLIRVSKTLSLRLMHLGDSKKANQVLLSVADEVAWLRESRSDSKAVAELVSAYEDCLSDTLAALQKSDK